MQIALATDDRYALACGVCITSILENNRSEDVHIFVLASGLSEVNRRRFSLLEENYGRKIELVDVSDSVFEGLKVSRRFPKSIYYRLMLPELLSCSKVIYLDCDIIVDGDLTPFWETEITDFAAVVVEDQWSDDIRIHNRIRRDGKYFNSGVMLFNLDYWRAASLSDNCIAFLHDNPQICKYPDQDAMNCVIGDDVKYTDYRFNFQANMFEKKEALMLHYSKWEEIEKWKVSPVVIHYTGMIKPWYEESTHPMNDRFVKYKSKSPWKAVPQCKYYGIKENCGRLVQNIKNKLFG